MLFVIPKRSEGTLRSRRSASKQCSGERDFSPRSKLQRRHVICGRFYMSNTVKLVECPRDAWQGLKGQIPTELKVQYLRALIGAGFKHIDAVSFVSPKAIPQMVDSEKVLEKLDPPDDVEAYISMAFGNPYGDLWNADEVLEAVGILADMGITQISLADTVGLATPQQVREIVAPVIEEYDHLEIGAHLHSTRAGAAEKVLAAYDAGCRRFDSAIGGLGGCPFAQDEMIGNIPTEIAVQALVSAGASVPLRKPLDAVIGMSAD